jgi:hypothetical protein
MLVQRNFVGKFSRRNMRLSEQQLQEYAQKGYLLLPALIDQVSLDAYNTRFLDIVGG